MTREIWGNNRANTPYSAEKSLLLVPSSSYGMTARSANAFLEKDVSYLIVCMLSETMM